jgi:SAM-dependent methyltransferase
VVLTMGSTSGGYRVLEIGCNWGYGTEILAERAGFVAAFDVNCEAVKQARELYGGGNIGFFVHDAGQPFPFADETFDLVFSSEVIEHIAAQECLLRESARVLRKKGTLALKTPNIHFDPRYHKLNPFHLHVFTYGELRRALGDYFAEVKIHTYDLEFSYQVHIRPRLESLHHEDRPDCFYLPNCAIVEGQIRRRIDELHSDKVPSQYFLAICRKC